MLRIIKNYISGVLSVSGFRTELKAFETSISKLDAMINLLVNSETDSIAKIKIIKSRAIELTNQCRYDELNVNELERFGASVAPLISFGINKMRDLAEYSTQHSLQQIRGIGPYKASQIFHAISDLKTQIRRSEGLFLDPDSLTKDEELLIDEVARLEQIKNNLKTIIETVNDERSKLDEPLKWIRNQSLLSEVNFDKEKQQVVIDYLKNIQPFYDNFFRDVTSYYHQIQNIPESGRESPRRRFAENSAWFFSLIENVSPLRRIKKSTINNFGYKLIDEEKSQEVKQDQVVSDSLNLRNSSQDAERDNVFYDDSKGVSFIRPPLIKAENKNSINFNDYSVTNESILINGVAEYQPSEKISTSGNHGEVPELIAKKVEQIVINYKYLKANLRMYQQFGAQYLILQKRTLLGDDMGLGKTIQVLAAMCHLCANGKKRFMVVAPNSVLINWKLETEKHTHLKAYVLHGWNIYSARDEWLRQGGVAITTYGSLHKLKNGISSIDFLAVDEAHAVKNPNTKRGQSVFKTSQNAEYVSLLSGTALENRLSELRNLIKLVRPDMNQDLDFFDRFIVPSPLEVRHRISPVYLRRTQQDVLLELPDKTEIDEYVELSDSERGSRLSIESNDLMNRRLATTVGDDFGISSKYNRLNELFDSYRLEGKKIVVFSFFKKVLEDISKIANHCAIINGMVSPADRLRLIDEFSKIEGFAVIACQVESGGQGLNIQCAQVVVLMEPQLKPSTERQAIARVYRMGQSRHVMVHRLIAKDSIDEDLVQLISNKAKIFDDYANPSSVKEKSSFAIDGSTVQNQLKTDLSRLDNVRRIRLGLPVSES
jgi:SNF2 family DNA or RNA helicase